MAHRLTGAVIRCLVVDSDPLTIGTVHSVCEARAIKATVVGCAVDGLKLASSEGFDIAFAGVRLPEASLAEFVKQLRGVQRRMRVVLLSAWPSIAEAVDAVRCGAEHYIPKPVAAAEVDRLLAGLTADVCQRRYQFPSLARMEWEYLNRVLQLHSGNVSRTAQALGIHRQSLQRKLRKCPPR